MRIKKLALVSVAILVLMPVLAVAQAAEPAQPAPAPATPVEPKADGKMKEMRFFRFLRTFDDDLPHELISGFVQCVDFEFEELGVSKAVGLALQDSDLGVGSFEWPGGDSVVVEVQDLVVVRGQGMSELLEHPNAGTLGSPYPLRKTCG